MASAKRKQPRSSFGNPTPPQVPGSGDTFDNAENKIEFYNNIYIIYGSFTAAYTVPMPAECRQTTATLWHLGHASYVCVDLW